MPRIRGKGEKNKVPHRENGLYIEEDDMVVKKIGKERVEGVSKDGGRSEKQKGGEGWCGGEEGK